ncbi:MAG: beta-N-acetylhexosaminidase [Desulforhopalus sp.]|jgi:beta-N-acetylhexosaminidase
MNYPPLDQMIGQLFIIGFKGQTISENDPIGLDIAERNLGGVILFDRHLATQAKTNNITGTEQLEKLTSKLQEFRPEKLLIAVDQEGGRVNRFREEFGFSLTPSAGDLGLTNATTETAKSSKQTAQMLRSCGINLNFAPVVDLNSNPTNPIIGKIGRSFSNAPDTVCAHASTWIAEHRKENILSCLKHFPGHGSSRDDSHLGFVDITDSWDGAELIPYENLIAEGLADAIMVGHLYNKAFDPNYPATLSLKTIKEILRQKLQYKGIVISDDMQMKAITDKYGLVEACIISLAAGVDMLIIGNNLSYDPNIFAGIHKEIIQAVDKGTLSEDTIKSAWRRVQNYKSLIK